MKISNINKSLISRESEVKKFSTKPRENMYIEILRFVSLIALVIIHTGTLADFSGFNKVVYVLTLGTGEAFDIHFFAFITGIFTLGKGKDYFLRNLSRNLFVFAMLAIVYLPIFFTQNVHHINEYYSWDKMIFKSSLWYLWAITIGSLFLPLIKLEFLNKHNIFISIFLTLVFLGLSIVFGWSITSPPRVFFLACAGYLSAEVYKRINFENKNIITLIVSVILLGVIFSFVYIESFEVDSIIFTKFRIFITILTGSIIISLIASFNKETPKKLNWLVKNSYFIYEFHHLFQIVWGFVLMSISSEHDPITGKVFYSNEGWMILSWVFVFISSILASFIITKIQYKIWERFIGRFIYKIKPYSIIYFVIALAFIIGHIMNCLY